nr:hypothetical protein [Tanacetum cinerariifolium]
MKEKVKMTHADKADVEKTKKEKGDAELVGNAMAFNYQVKESNEFPLPSSSLSVSSGFCTHFLNLSSDTSMTRSPSVLKVPILVILETTTLPPILEIPTETPVSIALSPLQVTPTILIMQQNTTTIPTQLIITDAPTITTVLQRHTANLIQNYSMKPESSKIQTITVDPKQESEKSALEIRKTMHENKYFNRNPANHALYHALMEALIEDENAMDKGVVDTVKDHKRRHDDDEDDNEDLPAGPNQGKKTKKRRTKESESSKIPSTTKETSKGKASSKSFKTGKSATTKELIKEPTNEVEMDDVVNTTVKDVVHDSINHMMTLHKLRTKLQCKIGSNKLQGLLLLIRNGTSDPLTFNDVMATAIDFSKYVLNRLQIDHLSQEILGGPTYNLLKGTCTNSFELGPFPLKSHPGHLTVAAEYFFNNDMEFLKSSDSKKSTIKHGYDKDAENGIKHWGERSQKILGVKSVSVKKLYGYGQLKEIVMKRVDRQLYEFKESDFMDLHLNNIEDMLLLVVQQKLFHLNDNDIFDFIVALRMFTISLIIKIRVEDLQLGIKSYQKKLNITEPQKKLPEIKFKELYTPSHKPPGVIYKDLNKQKTCDVS